ncbi:acetylornithine deacetylase/succinyl-diaminopimelate desuccinylase-like protein [Hamadaea flava]|uniref:M20/M25/M40 family metallo-hydrolase n=1 Tax=Hamadaea flava TaxID=1742688 RepID=A0ABV8LQV8_9ACTN|nr:M20/M25/M40 family metallo-hydrolase [Hamadaea flava]MCP2322691.1 acetylornithine deacetylase/succinyl-diaminopimelate desuccinylase-like protein [Hamadaea flava]
MNAVELRARVDDLMSSAHDDLAKLIAIRSVAGADDRTAAECVRAAEWVAETLRGAGFPHVRLLPVPEAGPTVYADRSDAGPDAPTVLLYAHYDVHPAPDEDVWKTPPFELTELDGRWYGRGASDCKGNLLMHLTAIRALGDELPVNLKVVVEGSAERSAGSLARSLGEYASLLAADVFVIGDAGNLAVGVPAVTVSLRGHVALSVTVETLTEPREAGPYGGPAPDALAALLLMLASFRDAAGNTNVLGLDNMSSWAGAIYAPARFREDAAVLDGVALLGNGGIADSLWARPAITVLDIDYPVRGEHGMIQPWARARLDLRVPPHVDEVKAAQALVGHLNAVAPWGAHVRVDRESAVPPFLARAGGPAYAALTESLRDVYGEEPAQLGRGGTNPLCVGLAEHFPDAEILLIGVEEPLARRHEPDESVDPAEIADMALVEALFLRRCGRVSPMAGEDPRVGILGR